MGEATEHFEGEGAASNERLRAFASLTFEDCFAIDDLKVIEGAKGWLVAMPSRKLTDRCHNCRAKNHLRARFCNQCGDRLDENRAFHPPFRMCRLHANVADTTCSEFRDYILSIVLSAYREELERSR